MPNADLTTMLAEIRTLRAEIEMLETEDDTLYQRRREIRRNLDALWGRYNELDAATDTILDTEGIDALQ